MVGWCWKGGLGAGLACELEVGLWGDSVVWRGSLKVVCGCLSSALHVLVRAGPNIVSGRILALKKSFRQVGSKPEKFFCSI